MYDLVTTVWNACSTTMEQGDGGGCSLSKIVLEDGCGDIVKNEQRIKKRYTVDHEYGE
jgi:hypothetical protein